MLATLCSCVLTRTRSPHPVPQVLTSSNAAAAAVLNQDVVPCCCTHADGAAACSTKGTAAPKKTLP